jgi:hypothetical protein
MALIDKFDTDGAFETSLSVRGLELFLEIPDEHDRDV